MSIDRSELLSFMQWLSYFGGEATVLINGAPISRDQAQTLVDAYADMREKA